MERGGKVAVKVKSGVGGVGEKGGENARRAKKGISSTLSPVNVCAHV
jgi:hypothetical protein